MSFIRVGQIVGAHGLRGLLKIALSTDFIERFEVGSKLRLKGEWVTVTSSQDHSGRLLIKVSGVTHRTEAEKLQWEYLEAEEEERPELDEGEFLLTDLVGLTVYSVEGQPIGKVNDVMLMPAHEILVVGKTLIPMVKEFVKEVDVAKGRIVVQLIEGMLEN